MIRGAWCTKPGAAALHTPHTYGDSSTILHHPEQDVTYTPRRVR